MNQKIISIIKRNPFLFLSTIVIIICLLIIVLIITKYPQPKYKNKIQPGSTTKQEVFDSIGTPESESQWQGYDVLNYKSNSKWNDQVFIENNQVKLIIEIVPTESNKIKSNLINKYGNPDLIMYGNMSPKFNLYAYPTKGFAMVATSEENIVYQLWYFDPINKNNFINNFANKHDYQTNEPETGP